MTRSQPPAHLLVLLFALAALCARARAQEATPTPAPDLAAELPGNYTYVDVMSLLRIDTTNALILDVVCPKQLVFNASDTQGVYALTIDADYSSDRECRIQPQAVVPAAFQRVLVDGPNVSSVLPDSGNVTLQQMYNAFPLYTANVTDKPLVCPLLQTNAASTTLVLHDLAYLQSVLAHYVNMNDTLGARFDSTPVSNVAPPARRYYVSMRVASPNAYVCTYALTQDRAALVDAVSTLLNPDATPGPSTAPASPSPVASPTPSRGASPSPSPKPACFPGAARAVLADGARVPMSELRIGDAVRDASGAASPVLLFTHADSGAVTDFVRLQTDVSASLLSPDHLVPVRGRGLVRAADVRVADLLTVSVEESGAGFAAVTAVGAESRVGLYNPQTGSGSLLVEWEGAPVQMSAYTQAVPAGGAHTALAPVRAVCSALSGGFGRRSAGGCVCHKVGRWTSDWLAVGNSWWPRVFAEIGRLVKPAV